ncbi:unnamed protein product [Nesidiocoris tenuis]|uniref:Uncharacterized protein n=1 Tax=Nesidiocoris tenuis TaxID=355587 RepID=A0A6H5GFC1_9HEMI|nr:unnamed protein product [Nesidiocoris tenuis]
MPFNGFALSMYNLVRDSKTSKALVSESEVCTRQFQGLFRRKLSRSVSHYWKTVKKEFVYTKGSTILSFINIRRLRPHRYFVPLRKRRVGTGSRDLVPQKPPVVNERRRMSKWMYWNRPKIENRNGVSEKTFSHTHLLRITSCISVCVSVCEQSLTTTE